MTVSACAELVHRGDPDRFLSTMTAPPDKRGDLFVLYAFNLEVARAPWMSAEPMIAEMRLQWWHDVIFESLSGAPPPDHEVAGPLVELIRRQGLPSQLLSELIEARKSDIYSDPPNDRAAFDAYIEASSGNLMVLAARTLGMPCAADPVVRDFSYASGVAALLKAVPELKAAGRNPLPSGDMSLIAGIVSDALSRLCRSRKMRKAVPVFCTPAMLAGWRAEAVLQRAARHPLLVDQGGLETSDFRRRTSFLWRSAAGLW